MGVIEIFTELGVQKIIRHVDYKEVDYVNLPRVCKALDDIVQNNRKTLLISDYDVDGLHSALIGMEALARTPLKNFEVFNYVERTHNIDKHAVNYAIQNKFEYVIITDTGSSELPVLLKLLEYGIKVIVLDHHKTTLTYDDFNIDGLACINTQLENAQCGRDEYAFSAGALCYTVYEYYLRTRGYVVPKHLVAYALITLYSDSMDMANERNRSIYFKARELDNSELPDCVKYFMENYTKFTRRFIEFWYAPRINSLFRSENFRHLNYFFFARNKDAAITSSVLQQIEALYRKSQELTMRVADVVQVTQLRNFVCSNLRSIEHLYDINQNKLYNYTGLIANKLCNRYNKPAIVYCETNAGYVGSFRDLYGRNYLSIFSNICDAGGHNPAFGFKLRKMDFSRFYNDLVRIDEYYSVKDIANAPVVIKYEVAEPDQAVIEAIAEYNNFSGGSAPIILLKKSIVGAMQDKYSQFYYLKTWGQDYVIQSSHPLAFGESVLIKPIHSNTTKLIVQ